MNIREEFLNFFKNKNHAIIESSSLIPDDASLLFTNAGMVQFKDIFTGKRKLKDKRATSSQVCMRAGGKHNDLENVGYTARHHTLFEMLGNFSFGDYFKEEAILFAIEFVTKVLNFNKDKIYISVHHSDNEAYNIWKKLVNENHIKKLGDEDNFWQMGDVGPCGPCSEIYIDQGESFKSENDYFGGSGDRFLEIWNLVFMQYEKNEKGQLHLLPNPSIDTGMGLERVHALMEGKINNFDTSVFMPLINACESLCNKNKNEFISSYRVIADHIRSITFLLAQGVNFNKEGRGYVLRRILRRAARHGYLLGMKEAFLYKLVDIVCESMKDYSYLNERKEYIKEQCREEENRFLLTIDSGMWLFERELEKSRNIFSGEVAFKLYDTYGFPLDLTMDMLKNKNIKIDIESFNKCMQDQKSRAKSAWKGEYSLDKLFGEIESEFGVNEFIGYEAIESKSKILALINENNNRVEKLEKKGFIFLDVTPLYPNGGGAIGDKGEIFKNGVKVGNIIDTRKYYGCNISEVELDSIIGVGEIVEIKVSKDREEIAKHHTATHLLHATLRKILGKNVVQAGSLINESRLRFDFTSHPLEEQKLEEIENEVNKLIRKNINIRIESMPIEAAKSRGAMALFGEKYGDIVRVVSFGEESIELCAGIHVQNTGSVGNFYIIKESGISSGVRRIEASVGESGYKYAKEAIKLKNALRNELKSEFILDSIKQLKKEKLKQKEEIDLSIFESKNINGVKLIIQKIEGEGNINNAIDALKRENEKIAILIIKLSEGKINIACGVKNINGLKANLWIKEICKILGGGGGGRDDFATAGGKYIEKVDLALKKANEFAAKFI